MQRRSSAEREKARLELEKLRLELRLANSTETQQKPELEIQKLKREISITPLRAMVLDKWIPAAIAAFALFTLVPLANWGVSELQKRTEFRIVTLQKQMEIF